MMDGNSTVPSRLTYTLNTPVMSYDSRGSAQAELNTRPVGSKFVCYYDSTNLGDVRLEKYDLNGFYASYITFYVFAGLAGLIFICLLAGLLLKELF